MTCPIVPRLEPDRDDPGWPRIRVGHEIRLLHDALLRREKHEVILAELADGQERRDLFVSLQIEQVDDGLATGRASRRGGGERSAMTWSTPSSVGRGSGPC